MRLWVDQMVEEYTAGKKALEMIKEPLDPDNLEDAEDRKLVNGMISDMDYSLEWMKKGRRPGNRRGIERRSAYQRSSYCEMDIFPSLENEQKEIPTALKYKLLDVLLEFSGRERECYLLHMSQGFSFAQIAKIMGLSRSSVQRYIERAKKKLKDVA